jgi:mono/diheme cytochrome c family protein
VRVRSIVLILFACLAPAVGCDPPQAVFAPNSKSDALAREFRGDRRAPGEIEKQLLENFGTPQQLVGWEKFPFDYGKPDTASPDESRHIAGWRLKEGRNLYMVHCVHCHGVAGDGAGPTAKFLDPRPRDYRQGKFKFTSTQGPVKPSHDDLMRVLEDGIPGTYMPSFVLLGEEKLSIIVDYVRWLSSRGELEIRLINELSALGATENEVKQQQADGKKRDEIIKELRESVDSELAGMVETAATDIADSWTTADSPDSVIVPKVKRTPPTAESIERGKKLYLSQVQGKKTQCADCHGQTGRGDGPNTELFWPIPGTTPERKYEVPGLHDEWGFPQQPRNLTRGLYRGGRRPVDLFRRVYAGIKGTQMPGFGGTVLTDEEIWDLVNYVLSIPFDGKKSAVADDEPPAGEHAGKEKVAAK